MKRKNFEIKIIYAIVLTIFLVFLIVPFMKLLQQAFLGDGSFTISYFKDVMAGVKFIKALKNSLLISITSALITTVLAFVLAYTIYYTRLPKVYKKTVNFVALLPMLLPTITYGFAIIYSFGKQGLLTRLFGHEIYMYGYPGLTLGYVIYTIPTAFMLIYNTMGYIDKKFGLVSKLMGDNALANFNISVLRPLWGTLATSIIQSFFLSFTDFGIPASVGGRVNTIAGLLYEEMLGSIPDFNRGAVVAIAMLMPSIISIAILKYLEKYNIRYNKISVVELQKNPLRDTIFGVITTVIMLGILSIFAVIFVIPFVQEWPYQVSFSLEHVKSVISDPDLLGVYTNSLFVAVMTAIIGVLISYGAALVTARSTLNAKLKSVVEAIALVINTIPGMVLGIAFMLTFTGTNLQSTFIILIICDVVHYFSTPYLMVKNSLSKMNASWETTAMLMGDSWIKTIIRVVTPNAMSTIIEVFSYYFVNAMVTISAIIFLAGAHTMVITTKIKELQYYNKFNEVFVLSVLILITNIIAKYIFGWLVNRRSNKNQIVKRRKTKMRKLMKKAAVLTTAGLMAATGFVATGCSSSNKSAKNDKVVIYSNADDEAVEAMKKTLDGNGYKGKYTFQTFGTSELGGKLIGEGNKLEADMITMSTFYVESAQKKHKMFKNLTFDRNLMREDDFEKYESPITAQEGTLILNTKVMKDKNLPTPTAIKDLAKPVYKGYISVTDVKASSTAWLLIQGLVSEYGEKEAQNILKDIYKNAGDHIEDSGSGPIKKVRAGEVAIGFGLRQQAVADKKDGLPIDYVDPKEGNFTLTESVAVLDKGKDDNSKLAMKMAECIIKKGRSKLIKNYPVPIYKGEKEDKEQKSGNPKTYKEKLTLDLLKQHQQLSENAMGE